MIKTEIINNLVHTWSDLGVMIHGGMPEDAYLTVVFGEF